MAEFNPGIHPVGHRILVLIGEVEEKSAGGIIVVTPDREEREKMMQVRARVIELGPECFDDQETQWCAAGDEIIIAKHSGLVWGKKDSSDGLDYRLINDLDVVAILNGGKKNVTA